MKVEMLSVEDCYAEDNALTRLRELRPELATEFETCMDLAARKGRDYGGGERNHLGNLLDSRDWGVDPTTAVMIRMSDKIARLKNFAKSGKLAVADETIKDTLRDLANYCLLLILVMDWRENETP